jgi:hypothetical protein
MPTDFGQMGQLVAEHRWPAHGPTERTLIDYRPQYGRLGPIQDPLTLKPRRDVLADLLVAVGWPAGPEQRAGITFGLQ